MIVALMALVFNEPKHTGTLCPITHNSHRTKIHQAGHDQNLRSALQPKDQRPINYCDNSGHESFNRNCV